MKNINNTKRSDRMIDTSHNWAENPTYIGSLSLITLLNFFKIDDIQEKETRSYFNKMLDNIEDTNFFQNLIKNLTSSKCKLLKKYAYDSGL